MSKIFLYFPQWQGSGKTNEIYTGASFLKSELGNEVQFTEINQPQTEDLETEHNVIGYQRILKNLESAKAILTDTRPDVIFTLGGDCGIEVCPVTYLNERYKSDLLVLWFDAHGDLNTPKSSPSKTFHGMPLRMILGDGDLALMQNCFSVLSPNQIVLVGTRDLDQPEQQYVQDNSISLIEPKNLSLEKLNNIIEEKGKKNIYVHLDLDVIDPNELLDVKCPTANGISFDQVQQMLAHLKKNYNVVGGSIVEYVPKKSDVDPRILELTKSIFLR